MGNLIEEQVTRDMKSTDTKELSNQESGNIKRFAEACGITITEALKIRDMLALVRLDLPRMKKKSWYQS